LATQLWRMNQLKTIELESFRLDHTKIKAPYVRLSKRVEVPGSVYEISTFDFRVRTPNTRLLTPKVTHSLEHLFAVALRAVLEDGYPDLKVLDVSPMGCRTGYYLTLLNQVDMLPLRRAEEVVQAMLRGALEIGELPGAHIETCGAYLEHDFEGARREIRSLAREAPRALEKPPILPARAGG
jgi:S-ribosylhomocysteine lyase